MNLLIVSICKDEAQTVGELISRIPKKYPGISNVEICIIDDGSTDETASIARKSGATVYSDGISKGLAYRFREVVDIALEKQADVLVNIDGDLQFMPEDIPKIAGPVIVHEADFVAADRFLDLETGKKRRPENMPLGKYYGNQLGAWVIGRLSGRHFNDVTCGFRAYSHDAVVALNLNSSHTYTQESFQIMVAKRMRIRTLPTAVVYYDGRKSRVVSNLFMYIVISTINIMRAYRDFAPLRFFFQVGAGPFIVGLAGMAFDGYHWLHTGHLSPYKAIGLGGLYLATLGIFFWSLGIMADMMVRILGTQEKTYEDVKRLRFPK